MPRPTLVTVRQLEVSGLHNMTLLQFYNRKKTAFRFVSVLIIKLQFWLTDMEKVKTVEKRTSWFIEKQTAESNFLVFKI